MTEPAAREPIGLVGRAHGRDGSFYLDQARRAPAVGDLLTIGGRERQVERRAGTDARPIVRLTDVDDRDAASALRGVMLFEADRGAALAKGEWRVEDLIGCRVEGLGVVRRVLAAPSCDLLEVGEESTLVPLVSDAVRRVDTRHRRIEIDPVFLGLEASTERSPRGDGGASQGAGTR